MITQTISIYSKDINKDNINLMLWTEIINGIFVKLYYKDKYVNSRNSQLKYG